ncbi:DUF805 domain-containing protein [Desulfobotulus sp. H1]|uniref:DUF805 domain-containing protein n=1 Tax=Desulfobotulus pelophilus TaxID=2823377 RepID=A0ABT3N5P4_9BACT|nr:DUF805 domain-containing protein [Desulfobotulus pelophilus]MCW7752786.1 DUF805 domain-containing protein [Desulfobotulus pelophilus]
MKGEAMDWYLSVLKQYAVFTGRSGRKEFWNFFLVNMVFLLIITIIEGLLGIRGTIGALYSLLVLMPAMGVCIRRLHDTGRSGFWIFLFLIPLLGGLVLLYLMAGRGEPGANLYGPVPYGHHL